MTVEETQFVPDSQESSGVRAEAKSSFGRYRVVAMLGSGATGSVFRAHDDELGRTVAIKTLHQSCDASMRARFHNEARAISSVIHPHILTVFDTGTDHATPFIVIELATGSLREAMRAHTLDVEGVRTVGTQIARALAAAHAAKILHRDVKPANILTTEPGIWKLADFGIARLPDSTLTDTGQFLGSPSYAAPESLRKGEFTPASDIYALAATLYEALAGAPPHGEHDMQSVVRKLDHDPLPLHLRRPVPREMADVIMAALARDPAARPTADDFAKRLAGETLVAAPVHANNPFARDRVTRIAIAAAILAACLLAIAIVVRFRESDPSAPAVYASPRVDRPRASRPSKPAPAPGSESAPESGSVPESAPGSVPESGPEPVAPAPDLVAPGAGDRYAPAGPLDPYAPSGPLDPYAPTAPSAPSAPSAPTEPLPGDKHFFGDTQLFDEHGNVVDDEAAARLLRELQRDARREWNGMRRFDRPRGRRNRPPRSDPY